jgi:hypothetical protein
VHDRSIKLRYGRNLVTKHSTFSYPSCDYIIYLLIPIFCQGQLKRKKRNISKAKNKNYSKVGYLVVSVKMNFNKFIFVPM